MGDTKFEAMLKKTVNPGKCREELVGNDYLSDVTFTLGENGDELKAHKFFLITASPVFHSLFVNNPETALDLKISQISKSTMTEICRFAYSEVVRLTQDNMLDVLFAASKFQMKFLMEKTIDFICKDGMDVNSVFRILELNQKDNNMRINVKCFEFIQKNHAKCFVSPEFLSLSPDLLRDVMQTCKVPRNAAKQAITLWSVQPKNKNEDLDELIALVSLNDENVENDNGGADRGRGSDCESVKSSKTTSTAGGGRQRQRQNRQKQQQQQPRGQKQDNRRGPKNFLSDAQKKQLDQQHIQSQQNLLEMSQPNGPKMFFFKGSIARKAGKFANLNLTTLTQPVSITEIQFIYDLSSTDKEFDLHIYDLTGKKTDLFYSRVYTFDKIDGVFMRYQLPRPCAIGNARKIWISIEFANSEHRMSYESFNVAQESVQDRFAIRREGTSSQIISCIVFKDNEN